MCLTDLVTQRQVNITFAYQDFKNKTQTGVSQTMHATSSVSRPDGPPCVDSSRRVIRGCLTSSWWVSYGSFSEKAFPEQAFLLRSFSIKLFLELVFPVSGAPAMLVWLLFTPRNSLSC